MHERRPGAGEILDGEEHAVFPGRGGEEHRVRLPLAGLEGQAGVAEITGLEEALQVDEPLVDDDRPQFVGGVHVDPRKRAEVPRRRLLDVLDRLEAGARPLLDLPQVLEHVLHVGAALVEVGAVFPVGVGLRGPRHLVDGERPLDVPLQVLALELDLDADEVVEADPGPERLRQAVVEPLLHLRFAHRIGAPHRMKERHARGGGRKDRVLEALPAEVGIEVAGEVVADQVG